MLHAGAGSYNFSLVRPDRLLVVWPHETSIFVDGSPKNYRIYAPLESLP